MPDAGRGTSRHVNPNHHEDCPRCGDVLCPDHAHLLPPPEGTAGRTTSSAVLTDCIDRATVEGVPTPPRSVRVPDAIWQKATARAKAEGTTVTAVILTALTRYAKGYKP